MLLGAAKNHAEPPEPPLRECIFIHEEGRMYLKPEHRYLEDEEINILMTPMIFVEPLFPAAKQLQ